MTGKSHYHAAAEFFWKTVTGTLLFTGSPIVVEVMAANGLDFVVIDLEHKLILNRIVYPAFVPALAIAGLLTPGNLPGL